MRNVAVLGLGYVGCVAAASLAERGHRVIGVDISRKKVDLVNRGVSPIIEPDLGPLLARVVADGKLSATTDVEAAITNSDVSLISVGTPSLSNGSIDLTHIMNVVRQVGQALRRKRDYHVVTLRSTILPGTSDEIVLPLLRKESGKQLGADFGYCHNPEFLREGTGLRDYQEPPYTVLGASDQRTAAVLQDLYSDIEAPLVLMDPRSAEMVKYTSNAFHALKVAFANEIGRLCKVQGVDGLKVMDIFAQDTKLNISSSYLRPGFAFGGSCLPKDLRALLHRAKSLDLELPVLRSILPSNDQHCEHALRLVEEAGARQVGLLGLSFKGGTDDLRHSPQLNLAERLLGKGYEVRIFDRNILLSRLLGANKDYLEETIPHISRLLVADIDELIRHSKTIVIGNYDPEFESAIAGLDGRHRVIDLVGLSGPLAASERESTSRRTKTVLGGSQELEVQQAQDGFDSVFRETDGGARHELSDGVSYNGICW